MTNETYQNWIYHTLYHLQRRNAPKGKILGMVTREELIKHIQEIEKWEWDQATQLEKEDGEIDFPHTRVQIANAIRGLEGRKILKKYRNKDGNDCLKVI